MEGNVLAGDKLDAEGIGELRFGLAAEGVGVAVEEDGIGTGFLNETGEFLDGVALADDETAADGAEIAVE